MGDPGLIPGLGRAPGGREWLPTLIFLARKFYGERSLEVYSPWGYKESDSTERLTLSASHSQRRRRSVREAGVSEEEEDWIEVS